MPRLLVVDGCFNKLRREGTLLDVMMTVLALLFFIRPAEEYDEQHALHEVVVLDDDNPAGVDAAATATAGAARAAAALDVISIIISPPAEESCVVLRCGECVCVLC